jgi:hypothetical protein
LPQRRRLGSRRREATGRLIEAELDPELLRRPAVLVAEAVLSAVTDAQDRIPVQAQAVA